jgi:hypothetical protein
MRKATETTESGRGLKSSVRRQIKREIPRRQWGAFCQQFSQDHQEWLVDVVPHGEGGSASHEAHGLPFEALTFHLDHAHEVFSIIVRNNDTPQGHAYQSVPQPCRVMIEKRGSGVILHIDSDDGSSTIIRFHRVATPDTTRQHESNIAERETPMTDHGKPFPA